LGERARMKFTKHQYSRPKDGLFVKAFHKKPPAFLEKFS